MNIAEILKHCPKGTKLYSLVDGEVTLQNICNTGQYRIEVSVNDWTSTHFTEDGKLSANRPNGECVLFPSKEQRDWSKFNMNTKVNDEETECQLKQSENVLVDNDIEQNYKRIPFNVELAKKIVNGKVKGRIVTMEGREVRIICWDKKPISDITYEQPIVVLATSDFGGERLYTCTEKGEGNQPKYKKRYDLIIEIPDYCYKDYYNFEPQKYQPCLVRDGENLIWYPLIYAYTDCQGKMLFYDGSYIRPFANVLPLSKVTERLIGTTKSYEQLIEELDENDQD